MTMGALPKQNRDDINHQMFSDMPVLRRKWSAALKPGHALPPYEEVMLGSLGRLADHVMLLDDASDALVILRAGRYVRDWLGGEVDGVTVKDLPIDCAIALTNVLAPARQCSTPVASTAHRVRDGLVETYDLLALPMANRWGAPLLAVYVCERGTRFDLVDLIYRSTDEGMLALAALRQPAGSGERLDFQILDLNRAAASLLQQPFEALQWRRLSESSNALARPDVLARLQSAMQTGRREQFEICLNEEESRTYVHVSVAAVGDLLCATLADVTEIKRSEQSFRLLFESNPMPMWVFDWETLQFLNVNDAALQHYGYDRQAFLALKYSDLWPIDEYEGHLQALRRVAESYESSQSWHHLKANGEAIEVVTYGRRVALRGRPAFLVSVVDITERRMAEARITYLAHHDALTDLPNRAAFHQRLVESLSQGRRDGERIAVLWVDLDRFKVINDSFGHPAGDALLKVVAARLTSGVTKSDLVARIGGDEFAVILEAVSGPEAVSEIAGRLIDSLAEPCDFNGAELAVGASIGIALYPDDGETADKLLCNADMALYRAKAGGRGSHHFFEPEMDQQARRRRSFELDLRKALSRGEFELYYQPLIDLASDEVVAFESLLRWHHPERGMVPPGEFVPVAEDTGLIVPIGEWILHQACKEAASWPDHVKIAVNLSPIQFRSRNLVGAVVNALAHSGLQPHRLELEITESVLLAETDANLATLHQLRALGVRISMDDFGTGYSSLGYLRSFPFDKIKIDRSFVSEIAQSDDCVAIIRAISGLGRSLGVRTTAEGVETAAQLGRLRDEGCTEVQGYYFSPPRPARDVAGLLEKFSAPCARSANAA